MAMAKKKWKKKERIERELAVEDKREGRNWVVTAGVVVLVLVAGYLLFGARPDSPPETTGINGDYRVISSIPSSHAPGKVTLTEFFDFTCPHCYDFHREISPLLEEKYGETLAVVDRGLPLRESSKPALEAYEIALEAGKGEEMKDALFTAYHERNEDISQTEVLAKIASDVGLDEEAFIKDLTDHRKAPVIDENIRLGNIYKLQGTPTFVVDGNLLVTDNSPANIETIIDSVLESD